MRHRRHQRQSQPCAGRAAAGFQPDKTLNHPRPVGFRNAGTAIGHRQLRAILGGGGPPDQDGGFTLRGTVSDRLGNNIVHLAINTLFIALVGWAAAALTGYLVRRASTPAAPTTSGPVPEA